MNKVQKKFICDALDQPENLNEWEYERMLEWADYPEDRPLTNRQNEILNHIQGKLD